MKTATFSRPTLLGNSLPSLLISLTDKSWSGILRLALFARKTAVKQTDRESQSWVCLLQAALTG